MSDLPENWIETEIGGLCSLKNGRAFKPNEWQTSGLPIVRIQNLNNPASAFNYFQGEVDERNRLRGGELLFAWSGTPGTSFGAHVWRGGEAVLNQHIFRVDFDEALLDKRFFRSAINQKLSELIDVAHGGVGLRHVTKGVFEKTLVALPPRSEQTRIANQLDTLLARVQACNDRFDAIPALLKRFRQTVLGAATNGALTAEWRAASLAKKWIACTVGQVLNGKPRNGYSPQAVDYETPIRSLTLSATTTGKFLGRHSKFIAEPIAVDSHLWLEPGDILIQRANSLEYVGVSAIFDGLEKQFIYPDLMMKCRPNEQVKNKYLFYALSAESTRAYFRENATGTAGNMPKINQQTVMSAPLLLPPLNEQTEIVRRAEALFALADRIEARCTAARAQAQRLTPLVLAKAFRGELVLQDPNDEPASALLARIGSSNTAVAGKNNKKVPVAIMERAQADINL
jgi:type I restriction enzyme S subunit